MLAVEKWAKGKHPTIAAFCFVAVQSIDEFEETFQQLKNPNSFPKLPIPPLKTWLQYYRPKLAVFPFLKTLIEKQSAIGVAGVQYGKTPISGAKQIDALGREKVIEIINCACRKKAKAKI